MTEEQLTEMAILKSKADKNILDRAQEAPQAQEAQEAPQVQEVPVTQQYKHSIHLSKTKVVNFAPWTGKTRKKLQSIVAEFDADSDEGLEKFLNILIYEQIENPDMYFTEVELQYLFIKFREISFDESYEAEGICEDCGNYQEMKVVPSCIKPKLSSFPKTINDMEFVDIKSKAEFEETVKVILDSTNDELTTKSDIEIAMHLNKNKLNTMEMLELFDNLDLRTITDILENLSECSFDFDIESTLECSECGTKKLFKTGDIPDIFSELL